MRMLWSAPKLIVLGLAFLVLGITAQYSNGDDNCENWCRHRRHFILCATSQGMSYKDGTCQKCVNNNACLKGDIADIRTCTADGETEFKFQTATANCSCTGKTYVEAAIPNPTYDTTAARYTCTGFPGAQGDVQ